MATKYGVEATKRENQAVKQLVSQGSFGGGLQVAYDSYTLTADLASADIIRLCKLPEGATIVDVRLRFDDLDASGGTIDVGWAAGDAGTEAIDADGFGAAIDVTSAGVYSMFTSQSTRPGYHKTLAEDVVATVTISGDTDATTGTIEMEVWYKVD